MRTGVIAKKMGMTRLFQEDGRHVPVTVLALEECAGRRPPRGGPRRLYRRPARRRHGQGEERRQAAARPFRQGRGRAQGEGRRVPRRRGRPARRRRRAHRRPFRRRPAGRRPGRHPGQGLCRRDEALGLRRPARHPRRLGLAPLARFDRQPPGSGHASSRTRRWPATWARATAPSRISRSSAPTPSRGLLFVKGSVPGSQGRLAAGQGRGQGAAPGQRALSRPASRELRQGDRDRGGSGRPGRGGRRPRDSGAAERRGSRRHRRRAGSRRRRATPPPKPPPRTTPPRLRAADESKEG